MGKKSKRPNGIVQRLLDGSTSSVNTLIEEIRRTDTVITWPINNYRKKTENGVEEEIIVIACEDSWKFILKITKKLLKVTLTLNVFNKNVEFGIRKSDGQMFTGISCKRNAENTIVAVIKNSTILNPENKLLNDDVLTMQWVYTARLPENNMVLMQGWQSTCYELMQNSDTDSLCCDLRDLYLSSRFHDFLLNFNEYQFKVHKFILCSRSSYFKRLEGFYPGFASQNILHDVDALVMHEVLMYMYSGVLKDMNVSDMIDVFDIACLLEIQTLIGVCINFFKANLCVTNIVEIFNTSIKNESEELGEEMLAFLRRQPMSILQSDEWSAVIRKMTMV